MSVLCLSKESLFHSGASVCSAGLVRKSCDQVALDTKTDLVLRIKAPNMGSFDTLEMHVKQTCYTKCQIDHVNSTPATAHSAAYSSNRTCYPKRVLYTVAFTPATPKQYCIQ